jgi:hypothetical protein
VSWCSPGTWSGHVLYTSTGVAEPKYAQDTYHHVDGEDENRSHIRGVALEDVALHNMLEGS